MKRIRFAICTVCALLCLFLIFALPACSKKTVTPVDRGMEVVSLMEEIANSDSVKTTLAGDDMMYFVDEIKAGNYDSYKAVYEIGLPQNLEELLLTAGYSESDLENPSLYASYEDALPAYIWEQVNNDYIYSFLPNRDSDYMTVYMKRVLSPCSAELLYTDSDLKMDTVYLYTFENGQPIAVCFTVGEGGAVRAQGQWILNRYFPTDSPENIRAYLEKLFPGCAFSVTLIEI